MEISRFFLFLFLLLACSTLLPFCFSNCHQKAADSSDAIWVDDAKVTAYVDALPMHLPDTCVLRIRQEIPKKFREWFCQRLYYRLPYGVSVRMKFAHLAAYQKHLPPSFPQRRFIQLLRGSLYTELLQFDSARLCLEDAYATTRENKMSNEDSGDVLRYLAQTYIHEGNYIKAIQLLLEVREIFSKLDTNEVDRKFNILIDLAAAYTQSKDFEAALNWNLNAWCYARNGTWQKGFQVQAAAAVANSYLDLQRPDSALVMAKRALDIEMHRDVHVERASLLYVLARSYQANGDCGTALSYFLGAHRSNAEQDNQLKTLRFEQSLGYVYLCLGRLDSAEWFYKRCLISSDTVALADINAGLSKVYEQRGAYQRALMYAAQSRALNDIIFNAKNAKRIAQINAQYEWAKQEARLEEAEKQRKITHLQTLLAILTLLSALGVLFCMFVRQNLRHRLLLQTTTLLKQEKELAEALEALKTRDLERSQADLQMMHDQLEQSSQLLLLKHRLIVELEMRLSEHQDAPSATAPAAQMKQMKILTDIDWRKFREYFEESSPNYIHQLHTAFPALTSAEIRLFLLIKLGFGNNEIAGTLGISQESVYTSRFRLRKKLGCSKDFGLDEFIQAYSAASKLDDKS